MRFKHAKLNNVLEWGENQHIAELVIESPEFLREILQDLSMVRDDSELVFMDNRGEILALTNNVDFIVNSLKLDFANKQATTALIKLLARTSVSEEHYMATNKLKTKIVRFIDELVDSENFTFEVDVEDFTIEDIAKAVSLHIVGDEDDFVELLTDYMTMMAELTKIKVFVFFNLRMLLNPEELNRLMKNADNHELDILLIEGKDAGKIPSINRLVVDNDLCEI